jgi:hypothetical protein
VWVDRGEVLEHAAFKLKPGVFEGLVETVGWWASGLGDQGEYGTSKADRGRRHSRAPASAAVGVRWTKG